MDLSVIAHYFDDAAKIVGAILLIGGAIWSFLRWVMPMLKAVNRSFVQMEKIVSVADAMVAEFRPNGGSSMKDAINRIEKNLDGVRNDLVDVRNDAVQMEARQWAIVASLPDPLFETNEKGELTRVNTAYMHFTGRETQEVLGNGWEIVIHPDDRGRVWQEWHDAVARLRAFESAYRVVDTEGNVYDVRCAAHPFKNPNDGSVLGYLGRVIDIKPLAIPSKKT